MTIPLPDEVWDRLDRDAGRMSRRTFATLIAGAVIVGLVGAGGLLGWRSGVLWPNIAREPSHYGWSTDTDRQTFEITFPVRNDGLVAVDVSAVGRSGPGLDLLNSTITRGHLAAGDIAEVALVYRVTDCDAIAPGAWPVPLSVSRGRTAYVKPPEMTRPDAPGSYGYSGNRNPYAMEWQVELAGVACGRFAMP